MKHTGLTLATACLCLAASFSHAEADLPPHDQVDRALDEHVLVLNAQAGMQIAQSEQRRRDTGDYEFTLQGGTYRDRLQEGNVQNDSRDWEIAIERPLRLPNKVWIDSDIGAAALARGQHALGDARHEVSRQLLRLWFTWQREQAQLLQWQAQLDLLQQQAAITEKRIKAGDVPRMELNQVNAAAAMSAVSMRQAKLRAALAADELKRQFPALSLPETVTLVEPQAITQPLTYWHDIMLNHNHEIGLAMAEADFQRRLAARASADRLPDPTVGLKYTSQLDSKQRIAGVYVSIPLGYSARSANADSAQAQARIATDQAQALQRKVEGDIYHAYTHAVSSYEIWQQASAAASALRHNADLVARAYSLGENSLDATLLSRRQALEATLAETLARQDANESRYRLLLDAHSLWSSDNDAHSPH
ncbi:TolC family protein [Ferrigenium sp. UT5]|uniref:TolC family protein n=1 Tax=Ferrigenium sp. UT5 TaxID=3242105 RepID=UPI00354CA2FC